MIISSTPPCLSLKASMFFQNRITGGKDPPELVRRMDPAVQRLIRDPDHG
jgi:hypothetical protein